MNQSDIIQHIREYYDTNDMICTTPFSKSFINRAVYLFGSWREAMFQAGIRKERPYNWSDILFYIKKYWDVYHTPLMPMDPEDVEGEEYWWVPHFKDIERVWKHCFGDDDFPNMVGALYRRVKTFTKRKYFKRQWTLGEIIEWSVEYYKSNYGNLPTKAVFDVNFDAPRIDGVIRYKELKRLLYEATFNIELPDFDEVEESEPPKKFDDISLLTDFGDEDGDEIENPLSEDVVDGVQKILYKSTKGKNVSENTVLNQVDQDIIPSLSKPDFEKFATPSHIFNKPFANYTRKKRWRQEEIDYLLSETVHKMKAEKYTKIAEYLDRTVIAIRKKAYRLGIRKKRYGIGGSKLFYADE